MNRILFPCAAILMMSGYFAHAQSDAPIKATVTMLPDGRQKNTVTNPDQRTTEETLTDNKGKVLSKTVYALDETNQPNGASFFDGKGKLLYKAAYQRDGAGRISEEAYESPTGQSLGKRVYTYGANNRVTHIDVYDPAGNLVTPAKPASPARPDKKKR